MSDQAVTEVFAAHRACGWNFIIKTTSETTPRKPRIVPPARPPTSLGDEMAQDAHAYGLQTADGACRLWGVTGCQPDPLGLAAPVHLPLWKLMGGVCAARLAASVLQSHEWTAAALDALDLLLRDLDRGLKTPGPWRHGIGSREAQRLSQTLDASLEGARSHIKSTATVGSPALAADSAVLVIARLDEAYYALLEHHLSCGHETPAVPPPHVYLPAIVTANPGNASSCKRLVREQAPSVGKHLLRRVWGVRKVGGELVLPDEATEGNPLLAVMWARFQEGCRLLFASGVGMNGEIDAVAAAEEKRIIKRTGKLALAVAAERAVRHSQSPARCRKRPRPADSEEDSSSSASSDEDDLSEEESSDASSADDTIAESVTAWRTGQGGPGETPWPAHRALREWRQSGRECHLYAYAPYTREALDALAERAPLVEVGAGLGYWAAALRARGVPILALDSHPPGGGASNNYHGRIPALTKVVQGGPRAAAAAASKRHTLILCYPPPASPMAAECLRLFRGDCVCVVGEWLGDTGDESFAAALLKGWNLLKRMPLPNWTDTAHELTIWQRMAASSGLQRKEKKMMKVTRAAVHSGELVGGKLGLDGEQSSDLSMLVRATDMEKKTAKEVPRVEAGPNPCSEHPSGLSIACCLSCGLGQGAGRSRTGGNGHNNHASWRDEKHNDEAVGKIALKRCCYCREAMYCSRTCAAKDATRHAEAHAMRLIFFKIRNLNIRNPIDFTLLPF